MMVMRRGVLLVLLGAVIATSACNRVNLNLRNPLQLGSTGAETRLPYDASLRADRDGNLTVTARRAAGASLDDLRESVRYPVTRHCIDKRGRSEADWAMDPATGDWAYTADVNGNVTFSARCRG